MHGEGVPAWRVCRFARSTGLTGSHQAAFLNGIAWNLLNMAIAFWILLGCLRPRAGPA
jgi:hypothetical protein